MDEEEIKNLKSKGIHPIGDLQCSFCKKGHLNVSMRGIDGEFRHPNCYSKWIFQNKGVDRINRVVVDGKEVSECTQCQTTWVTGAEYCKYCFNTHPDGCLCYGCRENGFREGMHG